MRAFLRAAFAWLALLCAGSAGAQRLYADGFEIMADTGWVVPQTIIVGGTIIAEAGNDDEIQTLNDASYKSILGGVLLPPEVAQDPVSHRRQLQVVFDSTSNLAALPSAAIVTGMELRLGMKAQAYAGKTIAVDGASVVITGAWLGDAGSTFDSGSNGAGLLLPNGLPASGFTVIDIGGPNDPWANPFDPDDYLAGAPPATPTSLPGSRAYYINFELLVDIKNKGIYQTDVWIDYLAVKLTYQVSSTARITGGATLAATLKKGKVMSRTMSGNMTITATANGKRTVGGAAGVSLVGSGKISPVISRSVGGVVYRHLMPELVGAGTIVITPPVRRRQIFADIAGTLTVTPTPSRGRKPVVNVILGKAYVDIALQSQRYISRNLAASGTIAMALTRERLVSRSLGGVGTVGIAMKASRPIARTMVATGTLGVTLKHGRIMVDAITANGVCTLSVLLYKTQAFAAAMVTSGKLAVELKSSFRQPAEVHCTDFVGPEDNIDIVPAEDNVDTVEDC